MPDEFKAVPDQDIEVESSRTASTSMIAISADSASNSSDSSQRSVGTEHHFATDHLLTNLKGRTVSGGLVTGVAQLLQFGLNLGSIMVLARLLTPGDFGLVAMVATITGFLRIFNDAGLYTATVQREGITHAQVSNLFWTNVALGGTITLVLAFSAPAVAWFYREPRLVGLTLALCLTFLFSGSAVQHLAILKRQMHFKTIAVIQISSALAGVLVGIGMAWLNYGYWSLVGLQLSASVVSLLLAWSASRWRPQFPSRSSGTWSLLSFGANLSVSGFIWCVARGSDGLLIGRFYGSAPLGLYSRAAALVSRPVEQFMAPLEAVFVPTLSRLQAQPERYRRIFLQVYETVAVASFPLSGLLLALSHPMTLVVLGPKWEAAAPIFAGFTLIALYTPIAGITGWLLISQCRGRDFLLQGIIGSFVTVVAFLLGLPFGPTGVALAYSLSCILILLPLLYYIVGRKGPVTTRDLWSRFFMYLPLWGIVCGSTFFLQRLVSSLVPWVQLMVCGSAGLFIGAGFVCIYPRARRTALELIAVLRDWRKARNVVTI